MRQSVHDPLVALAHALQRIDDEQHGLHLAERIGRYLLHIFAQPVLGRRHAGCIQKDDLIRLARKHARDLAARCLRAVGNDRDLLADHLVEQRGFARVRAADNGNKTGAIAVHARSFLPKECGSRSPSVVCSDSPLALHTITGISGAQNSASACRQTPQG